MTPKDIEEITSGFSCALEARAIKDFLSYIDYEYVVVPDFVATATLEWLTWGSGANSILSVGAAQTHFGQMYYWLKTKKNKYFI